MSYLTRHLRQQATYWAKSGKDSSGDPSFKAPKAIFARWEEKRAVFTGTGGEEAVASAIVFVKEDMRSGDFLFLGTSTTADPLAVTEAREVQGFSKIPELQGGDFERKAFLSARGAR